MEYRKKQILFYNIKELIRRRGISISTLCKEVEIPESRMYGWENGASAVSSRDLEKVAKYFGISTDDLLSKECLDSAAAVPLAKQDKIYRDVLDAFGLSAHNILKVFNSMSDNNLRAAELECLNAIKHVEVKEK